MSPPTPSTAPSTRRRPTARGLTLALALAVAPVLAPTRLFALAASDAGGSPSPPAVSLTDTSSDATDSLPAASPARAELDALIAGLDPDEQQVAPLRLFDDLYYVGIEWVDAYLLDTGDGLVLIDTTWGRWVDHLLAGVRSLGFDPADIRLVLVTHGHFDHGGGAARVQRETGARVAMTAADWDLAEAGDVLAIDEPYRPAPGEELPLWEPLPRDRVLADGEVIEIGRSRIEVLVTPGHTPGVASLRLTVHDRGKPVDALLFGGAGLNFKGVERTESYLASVRRLRALEGLEVNLPNHPGGGFFERARRIAGRGPEEPHPLVDPEGLATWLARLEERAEQKLATERAAAAP